jgi:hypothetical protein
METGAISTAPPARQPEEIATLGVRCSGGTPGAQFASGSELSTLKRARHPVAGYSERSACGGRQLGPRPL